MSEIGCVAACDTDPPCGAKHACFRPFPGDSPPSAGLAVILLYQGHERRPVRIGTAKETRGLMKHIALAVVVTGLASTSAWAEEPAAARLRLDGALAGVTFAAAAPAQDAGADAASPVSVTVGADIPSTYFFRGFRQEGDPGFTFQPYADVAFAGERASFNVGVFSSLHTGSLKDAGYGFYETDFYAGVTVGNLSATYTAYTYPKIDDSTVHELMLSAAFDHALAPSAAIAFEFAKPEGLEKGVYFELGIEPAVPLADGSPVTISIPVKIGTSLKDYYGDFFGYLSAGVNIGRSLSESAEIHGSVTVYGFGETLKYVNNDKAGQVVASVGFSVGF